MINLYIFNEICRANVYGIGTYLKELTVALKKSDINVCVINLYSKSPDMEIEEMDGIKHWYIPAPIYQPTTFDWYQMNNSYCHNIIYLLRLEIEDVTSLVFQLNYNQSSKLSTELKNTFNCKIITTVHYLDWALLLFGNTSYFKQILTMPKSKYTSNIQKATIESYKREKELFETVDHIICLSKNTQQILLEDYRISLDKTIVIYNGLTNKSIVSDKSMLNRKYFKPEISTILFVGRIDDSKGLKYTLRAFKTVLKTCPSCHLIIVGDGDWDSHIKECEEIWMRVTWTGLISKEKLYDLYSIADIGILPSFHEQCSYVAIEMMMHSIPLIASNSTGLQEMIKDKVTGLHIPIIEYNNTVEIDTNLLAEKIIHLLKHPTEAKKLGMNAYKLYEERYSNEIFRENMLNFYHSLSE